MVTVSAGEKRKGKTSCQKYAATIKSQLIQRSWRGSGYFFDDCLQAMCCVRRPYHRLCFWLHRCILSRRLDGSYLPTADFSSNFVPLRLMPSVDSSLAGRDT